MTKEDFRQALEARITGWFEGQKELAPTDKARDLIQKVQTLVQRGGKRSRPELLFLTYEAYGGSNPQEVVDVAAALELYHQFLLVHDDIMDKDTVRYGGPNIVGMYEDEGSDIAQSLGILAGDLLFTYANQLVLGSALPQPAKLEILSRMHRVNADEMFGQQLDIYNVLDRIDSFNEEKLTLIHELKTARYTTQLPMSVAAAILKLPEVECVKLEEFGRLFGVAYQLADDYSDYFENDSNFSAQKHRDYRSGKVTLPIFLALKDCSETDRAVLLRGFGDKQASDADVHSALRIIEDGGAKASTREFTQAYHRRAIDALAPLNLSEEGRVSLVSILEKFRI